MDDAHGTVRAWVGRVVDVAYADGRCVRGTLLNVNRRSLWLVEGDDHDVLIPWQEVAEVR
jgi:hypothetical protein